ncbi:MAG: FkbM family methyltransferase [Chloroherpetonaceae bacterium]|nr:FkbM family methyltransferase [Chloroherpetonaceae bacterium]MDW8436654.1 FkbM family methyltransferase [Chloroherpetonaceae bacterium]
MQSLKKYITAPLTLIDIGARAGINARWKNLPSKVPMRIIGFEPDEAECATLNAKGDPFVKYLPLAVGNRGEARTFHLLQAEGSSSLFRPNYVFVNRFVSAPNYAIKREVPVATQALDDALKQAGIDDVDYVKIDTEGCERDILNGAGETLKRVFAVEVEVWFNRVFSNAPLFRDIDALLAEQGFVLFDLAKSNYFKRKSGARLGGPKGQLVAGDAIYFRDIPALPKDSLFYAKDKLVRAIVLTMQYRYFDFAMEIAESARQHQTLSESEFKDIAAVIEEEGRGGTVDFRGKHTAEKVVKRLGRFLTKFEWDYLGNW